MQGRIWITFWYGSHVNLSGIIFVRTRPSPCPDIRLSHEYCVTRLLRHSVTMLPGYFFNHLFRNCVTPSLGYSITALPFYYVTALLRLYITASLGHCVTLLIYTRS
jgi:hypothetical protein